MTEGKTSPRELSLLRELFSFRLICLAIQNLFVNSGYVLEYSMIADTVLKGNWDF